MILKFKKNIVLINAILLLIVPLQIYANLKIITTLFPLYDFAKTIAGSENSVSLILPPGVEPHSFEPTPRDMVKISESDIFIYTRPEMEPWAVNITKGFKKSNMIIIEGGKNITLKESVHEYNSEHKSHNAGKDPHIWLDPILCLTIVDNITDGLCRADSINSKNYKTRADALKLKLIELDKKIKSSLSNCKSKTIISGGHFAFGYFVSRYNLNHISPYHGFSPDAKPTPKKIVKLIKQIKTTGSKFIYFEELVNPRISKTVSKETGAELLLLHGAHNVSRKELELGITYFDIMNNNIKSLKKGLDCK